ncbi:hypothetical protein [Nonomuraea sp. SYSU D8015]|nr:hypothetical protein [Nonomuraea sp. SYSU D8015]
MGRHEKPHSPKDKPDETEEGSTANQHQESRGKHAAPPKDKK